MRKHEAMREVAREVLSFPCLREFKKRLEKEAGWDALENPSRPGAPDAPR